MGKSDVRRREAKVARSKSHSRNMHTALFWIPSPDSYLLPLRNEGDSGDMYENKGSALSTMLYHDNLRPGTHEGEQLRGSILGRALAEFRFKGQGRSRKRPMPGYPQKCLKTKNRLLQVQSF